MRALAFLFALYFAVLGCWSCADEPTCPAPAGVTVLRSAPAGQEPHGLADWCSPLCQCTCCAGVVLPQSTLRVAFVRPAAPAYAARRYAPRPPVAVPARAPAAPWQPPQRA